MESFIIDKEGSDTVSEESVVISDGEKRLLSASKKNKVKINIAKEVELSDDKIGGVQFLLLMKIHSRY